MSRLVLLNTTTTIYSTRQLPNEVREASRPPSFYGFILQQRTYYIQHDFSNGKTFDGENLFIFKFYQKKSQSHHSSFARMFVPLLSMFAQITNPRLLHVLFIRHCSDEEEVLDDRFFSEGITYYALERKVLSALGF